jgi:hypothetical protein
MSVNVFAVKGDDQETRGVILCGLGQEQIRSILNVFRTKNACRLSDGVPLKVMSLAAPVLTQRLGRSVLLRVGNPHAWSPEIAKIHEVGIRAGDDLVTGPNGFCVAVDEKDEECIRAFNVLAEAFAQLPLSERKSLRTAQAIMRPLRPRRPLSENLWTLFDLVFSVRYRKGIAQTIRTDVHRWTARQLSKADCLISRAFVGFFESCRNTSMLNSRPHIKVSLTEVNGAPAIMFKVGGPKFIPRPIKNSVRRLGQRWGITPDAVPA